MALTLKKAKEIGKSPRLYLYGMGIAAAFWIGIQFFDYAKADKDRVPVLRQRLDSCENENDRLHILDAKWQGRFEQLDLQYSRRDSIKLMRKKLNE